MDLVHVLIELIQYGRRITKKVYCNGMRASKSSRYFLRCRFKRFSSSIYSSFFDLESTL